MILSIPVSNNKALKVNFKKLFFPFLVLIAVIMVLFKFSELREIGRLFTQAKWHWLLAAFGTQCMNFAFQGNVYNTSLKILKIRKQSFMDLVRYGITILFLNFTIPSLGFAGNIWFMKQLKKQGIKEGRALLVIVIEFLCYYTAFAMLLVLALVYLFFKLGNVGHTQKIAVAGFCAIFIFIIFIVYFFIGNQERSHKRVFWLAQKIDKAEDGVNQDDRIRELLKDFYEDFGWLKKNKRKIIYPATMQLAKFLSDGLTIFFIFLAFGSLVPVGLGVVAFAFGRLFGLVSFIPGGVGAFEGAMVLIFNSLGVSLELALAVMLVYRLFSFWMYFPLGLIFYRKFSRNI
ncbi:MAG: lysylphosphatidylglycerol synthase transmembrane domain-containing protein [Patescibacteria group bacterium]